MLTRAQQIADTLVALRRQVHRQPELGFQEHRTAQLAAERLAALGIAVQTGPSTGLRTGPSTGLRTGPSTGLRTSVVGDLATEGRDGPCIALRADMDALPIQEENDVPYASQVPGVMHACGHDVHVACLLGAAQLLAEEAEAGRLPGRVRFLFQPAEEMQDDEGQSGGMRMAEAGVMAGVDAVAGLHVWADLEVGAIGVREGTMTAYPDKFRLTVKGQAAHGAYPQKGHDAITITAQVINALQTVVSRRLDPTRGKVLTVGTIQGGTKDNIVAGEVQMTGTIRTFEPETRERLIAEMERACGVARALGGDFALTVIPGYIPVVNDPAMTALVRRVGADLLGAENVRESPLEMGGEDFSYFAREAPGCLFWLGGATPGAPKRRHHHPRFDVDERCLPLGAALLAETAIRYLEAGTRDQGAGSGEQVSGIRKPGSPDT